MIPGARPIPRVIAPSLDSFRRTYERPRQPVVITGALDGRPALTRWSLDHLAANGDLPVRVRVCKKGTRQLFSGDMAAAFEFRTMPLRAAVERIGQPSDEVWYVQHGDLRDAPRLAGEIGPIDYLAPRHSSRSLLWVCGGGTVNPLHWDTNHVLLAQIVGEKRFVIFPPEDSPKLGSFVDRTLWRTTALDLARVDRTRFPRFDSASAWSCSIEPGDILFIPYRWWHYMECDDVTISVSWWWAPSLFAHFCDSARELGLQYVQRGIRRINATFDPS
jgi:[protein]-arginine 3-hydroxylase / protease